MELYELWFDRNLAGEFDTAEEALAAVRAALDQHGRDYALNFWLVTCDSDGDRNLVAEGEDLIGRALNAQAPVS